MSESSAAPDHTTEGEGANLSLQVELTYAVGVEIELPAGVTAGDLTSARLHRWPDEVLEAIYERVGAALEDRRTGVVSDHITQVDAEDPDLDISATW